MLYCRPWSRLVVVFAFAVVASPLLAEEGSGLNADSFLGDLPVFLTVTRLPQNLSETPASVMIIDRQMIRASGVVEIPDLLRLVPGFVVAHYQGTDGNRTVVSYYGVSDQYARRLQVLVDGMSVYMPATGSVEWPDLPLALDDIERIEVVRGPNGAAYGSNSFLGVINIITRNPHETESKLGVTAGSVGYREGIFRLSGGERLPYRLTGSYKSSRGYRDEGVSGLPRREVNADSITRSLTWRGDYRASANDYWTFQAGYGNGPRKVGVSTDPLDPVRYLQVETDYQQIRWSRMLDSESEFQVNVYRNFHRKKDRYNTGWLSEIFTNALNMPVTSSMVPFLTGGQPDQRLLVDTGLESERQNVEASYRFRPAQSMRLVFGGEYRIDRVKGSNYFDTGHRYTNEGSRLFFNSEWKPAERWTVNLGDVFEKNDLIGDAHSPRLSVSRLLSGPHFVRATASRAYRTPAFAEEKLDFTYRLGDGMLLHRLYSSAGNLRPERVDNAEMALGADVGNFAYEAKLFRNAITSLITTASDASSSLPSWQVMNGGDVTIQGAELQTSYRPEPDLLFSLGYSSARAKGWRIKQLNPSATEKIDDTVPQNTLSLLFSKQFEGGDQAGIAFYSISAVRHFAGDVTPGVTTADVNYSHPFQWSGHQAAVRTLFRDVLRPYFDFQEETNRSFEAFLALEVAF